MIFPNLEKIRLRSSSLIAELSLQMKRTFSGGCTFAKGRLRVLLLILAKFRVGLHPRRFSVLTVPDVESGGHVEGILGNLGQDTDHL